MIIELRKSSKFAAVNLKKSDFVAGRLSDAYLFGEHHPYGKYSNAEDIDAMDNSLLKEYFRQYYLNGRCVIFVSGKLPAELQQQLNRSFGDLNIKAFDSKLPVINALPAAEKKYRIQNDPDGVQGAIRIARSFPNRHHPDFMKVMVLNTLFGGFYGSRLMANIREDKGYTYGIHSYVQNHIQQSGWMISTEAGKDVCEATISEVYKEMKELFNDGEVDSGHIFAQDSIFPQYDVPVDLDVFPVPNHLDIDGDGKRDPEKKEEGGAKKLLRGLMRNL